MLITLVPKSTFLFFWLNNIGGLLLNFYWLVHSFECQNVSTTNCNIHKDYFCVSSLVINLSAIVLSLSIPDIKHTLFFLFGHTYSKCLNFITTVTENASGISFCGQKSCNQRVGCLIIVT